MIYLSVKLPRKRKGPISNVDIKAKGILQRLGRETDRHTESETERDDMCSRRSAWCGRGEGTPNGVGVGGCSLRCERAEDAPCDVGWDSRIGCSL